jgi:hypothetical protein
MRILKFELKKLAQTPMFWVFALLSIALNAYSITNTNYLVKEINEFSREVYTCGEYKNPEIGDVYADYPGGIYAERITAHYNLSPFLANLMQSKYEKMQSVADEFSRQEISHYLYAGGMTTYIHGRLFSSVMRLILTQAALFAALAMLCSLGYERQNKTESVVYPSRTGRKIMRHKYLAGLIFGAVGFAIIAAGTFAVYFSVWDYSGFWQSNVSSAFNTIFDMITGQRPFITWQSFTVSEYLTATAALGFVLTIVFAGVAGVIGLLFRNTYTAFGVFGIMLLSMMFLCMLSAEMGFMALHYVTTFTPVIVWYMVSQWFTDMGAIAILPWHETWAMAFNLIALAIFTLLAMRYFRRRDLL